MPDHDSLPAVIDRLEGELVVLRFDDGQELAVPRRLLPTDCQEGSHLFCRFATNEQAAADQAARAKQLLTEILKAS